LNIEQTLIMDVEAVER